MLEALAEWVSDGDREQDRAGAEDAEPDDGIEPAERRQPDVADEVRLPEPVVALAPHPGERCDAEDREQRRPRPHEARAVRTRMAHLGERPTLLPRQGREPRLRHRQREEGGEHDLSRSCDNDRQAQVDDRETDARADPGK